MSGLIIPVVDKRNPVVPVVYPVFGKINLGIFEHNSVVISIFPIPI
ncbi:hypothetical protein ACFP7A_06425 [Sporolactobacillus kofuensis]|uniref:Uncharacterized protein n=1 Tax=Sporolactobacillus kofuensis TaxID=269672 RepID=A0ABW1WCA6_9BACL|nr:hypothetical protein [Sporolactobacillus kofuensis]MCO7175458.1 hypothetical protein [Sporolactobacillus kofuensis]